MKKTLFGAMLTMMVLAIAGCNPDVEENYPKNLLGYWASTPNADGVWYSLEVDTKTAQSVQGRNGMQKLSPVEPDAANGVLTTYAGDKATATEKMSVVYFPSNGKGSLSGEGKLLNLQALTDTTLTITMVSGEVLFTRGIKPDTPDNPGDNPDNPGDNPNDDPKGEVSMEGYWVGDATDEDVAKLLIFAPDEQGNAHMVFVVDEEMIPMGMGAEIRDFDKAERTGKMLVSTDEGLDTTYFALSEDGMTLSLYYNEGDAPTEFTKQPKTTNDVPATTEGTWVMKPFVIPGMVNMNMTAVVDADGNCTLDYDVTMQGQAQKGQAKGVLYYSTYSGRGSLEITDAGENASDMVTEMVGVSVLCEAVSPTKVEISIMSGKSKIELNKQ